MHRQRTRNETRIRDEWSEFPWRQLRSCTWSSGPHYSWPNVKPPLNDKHRRKLLLLIEMNNIRTKQPNGRVRVCLCILALEFLSATLILLFVIFPLDSGVFLPWMCHLQPSSVIYFITLTRNQKPYTNYAVEFITHLVHRNSSEIPAFSWYSKFVL